MKELLDAFWRAAAYCLHPRVIGLSLLPLLVGTVLAWLGWCCTGTHGGRRAVRAAGWPILGTWCSGSSASPAMACAPCCAVADRGAVAAGGRGGVGAAGGAVMTPAIVSWLRSAAFRSCSAAAARTVRQLWVSLSSTLLALALLLASLPLWFVPPFVLVLPPLIWGWLTYRVMSLRRAGRHADAASARLVRTPALAAAGDRGGHRLPRCGTVAAVGTQRADDRAGPAADSAAIWLYTLVFAFSALWFVHYCLAQLEQMRGAPPPTAAPAVGTAALHALPPR
jgi:hypothetical protein